jgi:hypothetical protein
VGTKKWIIQKLVLTHGRLSPALDGPSSALATQAFFQKEIKGIDFVYVFGTILYIYGSISLIS